MRASTSIVAVAVAVVIFPAAAHAGRGVFVPPVEIDHGISVPVGAGTETVGPWHEVLAGLSWASLAWKPTRFDVGVGYAGSYRRADRGFLGARAEAPGDGASGELSLHGAYLQLGTTIASHRRWRTWLAARGELFRGSAGDRAFSALGAAVRIATEVYLSAKDTHRGLVIGTLGLGIYVEAAYREVPDHFGPTGLTTGLALRLPLVVAGS